MFVTNAYKLYMTRDSFMPYYYSCDYHYSSL